MLSQHRDLYAKAPVLGNATKILRPLSTKQIEGRCSWYDCAPPIPKILCSVWHSARFSVPGEHLVSEHPHVEGPDWSSIARITRSQPLFTPTLTRKPSRRRSCPTWTLYPRALGAMKPKCDTIPKHQSSNLTILRLDLVMRSLQSLSLVIAQFCQARLSALSNKLTKSAYNCEIHHGNHIFSTRRVATFGHPVISLKYPTVKNSSLLSSTRVIQESSCRNGASNCRHPMAPGTCHVTILSTLHHISPLLNIVIILALHRACQYSNKLREGTRRCTRTAWPLLRVSTGSGRMPTARCHH
jgi:hypothetical protein